MALTKALKNESIRRSQQSAKVDIFWLGIQLSHSSIVTNHYSLDSYMWRKSIHFLLSCKPAQMMSFHVLFQDRCSDVLAVWTVIFLWCGFGFSKPGCLFSHHLYYFA